MGVHGTGPGGHRPTFPPVGPKMDFSRFSPENLSFDGFSRPARFWATCEGPEGLWRPISAVKTRRKTRFSVEEKHTLGWDRCALRSRRCLSCTTTKISQSGSEVYRWKKRVAFSGGVGIKKQRTGTRRSSCFFSAKKTRSFFVFFVKHTLVFVHTRTQLKQEVLSFTAST